MLVKYELLGYIPAKALQQDPFVDVSHTFGMLVYLDDNVAFIPRNTKDLEKQLPVKDAALLRMIKSSFNKVLTIESAEYEKNNHPHLNVGPLKETNDFIVDED
jgi:hypothetical protein